MSLRWRFSIGLRLFAALILYILMVLWHYGLLFAACLTKKGCPK